MKVSVSLVTNPAIMDVPVGMRAMNVTLPAALA